MLDKGEYKVVPFSDYYYKIIYDKEIFYILFNGKVSVFDKYNNSLRIQFINRHAISINNSSTSYTDIYEGTICFFKNRDYYINLLIISTDTEVDGFFEVMDDINLFSYKAQIVYSNFIKNNIEKGSLLLYEIKSGNQSNELKNQISKRCQFICKYIQIFYGTLRPIFYFGFFRENKIINYELNLDKSEGTNANSNNGNDQEEKKEFQKENQKEEKKEDQKEDKNEGKKGDKKDEIEEIKVKNKEENEKNNLNKIKENKINEDIMKNDDERDISNEENNKSENNNIISRNEENFKIENYYFNKNYSELNNLPAGVVIFNLKDSIFDEKLIYEKEELNLLGTLRQDVISIKTDIIDIKKQIGSLKDEIKKMDEKNEKRFKAIMKALGIEEN